MSLYNFDGLAYFFDELLWQSCFVCIYKCSTSGVVLFSFSSPPLFVAMVTTAIVAGLTSPVPSLVAIVTTTTTPVVIVAHLTPPLPSLVAMATTRPPYKLKNWNWSDCVKSSFCLSEVPLLIRSLLKVSWINEVAVNMEWPEYRVATFQRPRLQIRGV